jgi:hypothetical protein
MFEFLSKRLLRMEFCCQELREQKLEDYHERKGSLKLTSRGIFMTERAGTLFRKILLRRKQAGTAFWKLFS